MFLKKKEKKKTSFELLFFFFLTTNTVPRCASEFRLHVLGYNGTAGDGLGKHDGMMFSTKDQDNDLLAADQMGGSCARRFHGAGWYYKCYMSNLMGNHYVDGAVPDKRFDGVAWKPWTGPSYSLKEVVMKVRPREAG